MCSILLSSRVFFQSLSSRLYLRFVLINAFFSTRRLATIVYSEDEAHTRLFFVLKLPFFRVACVWNGCRGRSLDAAVKTNKQTNKSR